jgi:D-arabinose 1-dehydrogenase-like Zn-dependent alcohol dehydrogenase
MQAIRVHHFGGLDSLVAKDVPRPAPGTGEVLLRVKAAGVGPWDAWIRSGRSVLPQRLPLTPGSDVAGQQGRLRATAAHRAQEWLPSVLVTAVIALVALVQPA